MRVFDVYLNGEKLCTAGTEEECALTSIIAYVRNGKGTDCFMSVGASVGPAGDSANWVSQQQLKAGDEITVRIRESDEADQPSRRPVREIFGK